MKEDNVLHFKVKAAEGSPLEKGVDAYLKDLKTQRKKIKEEYEKGVEKQLKKIERSRL